MITILDYGLGNIHAFVNSYKRLNLPVKVASSTKDLDGDVSKLILPGVGAFDSAMNKFNNSGLRTRVEELVKDNLIPILGVCVGMQMLGNSSDEGEVPGLEWINGKVKHLNRIEGNNEIPLPHMGWNDVKPISHESLFKGSTEDCRFYFLHSYYFECEVEDDVLATCEHTKPFCCAVNKGNIYGVQFHPEKSHHFGLNLLNSFAVL